MLGEGKRFNSGKTRHDLAPAYAQEQYARVLTMGAEKYGDDNWKKGMAWSKVIASLSRHVEAIKKGEDIDQESGLLHSAHVMCNAAFLTEYYKIYPQGDDRGLTRYLLPRVGLDIDGVLAAFSEHYLKWFGLDPTPAAHWNDKRFRDEDRWKSLEKDPNFWLSVPTLVKAEELLFEPVVYVTARSIDPSVTQAWLNKHNFPVAPLISVGRGGSKVEALKEHKVDIYVDDSYPNFVELNLNGIFTYLKTRSHNIKYSVGHKRINNLNEIVK